MPSKKLSRPVRARGLKLVMRLSGMEDDESRPVRARGLKPVTGFVQQPGCCVAPRAGAWIETVTYGGNQLADTSRPVRARGLKHYLNALVA